MSVLVVASFIQTHFASDLSCHSNHLICSLEMSKSAEPLKGDAHEENTFCSYKLFGRGGSSESC